MIDMQTRHRQLHFAAALLTVTSIAAQATQIDAASAPKVELKSPANHGGMNVFAVSDDGKKLAGASSVGEISFGGKSKVIGGEVFLWDRRKGKITKVLGKHATSPTWLGFTPEGKTLVSFSADDCTAKVWKLPKAKPRAVIELGGPGSSFDPPALSRDGKTLIHVCYREMESSGGTENGYRIEAWDLTKKKLRWQIQAEQPNEGLDAKIAISPDSKRVALAVNRTAWTNKNGTGYGEHRETFRAMLDLVSGEELWRFDVDKSDHEHPHPQCSIAFTPDGSELVFADWYHLDRYEPSSGKSIGKTKIADKHAIQSMFFDRTGQRVLIVRSMSRDMQWYSYPGGELEYAANFKFEGIATCRDLSRLAGRARATPMFIDLSKQLKR